MTKLSPSKYFPPVDAADEEGLMLFGGQLTPNWLLDAYSHGIFPWPICDRRALLAWWSPDPRAIIELDELHLSRSLQRTLRRGKFRVTCNRAFGEVIRGCATADGRAGQTWLCPEMIAAYEQMHRLGYAMSVETWAEEELVGGTYGISLGGFFAAESMFFRQSDASKVALVALVRHLRARGYTLLDIQQLTDHTRSLGASEIPRSEYLRRLEAALKIDTRFGIDFAADCGIPTRDVC
ncbi:MAG: leucyl/phenylalanyl-tRNA--protein transferase [Planctomycetota bacterium]|nr:MAG: leucyl/phenylalanyl-tRNA--protein transferase [Planctomycetota bacterium]REJ96542.1 MAG: leucyl/phenylalanyl-tRNA--protein transferase [Planctomycetota bacterium]